MSVNSSQYGQKTGNLDAFALPFWTIPPPMVWKLLFAFGRDGADRACLANGTRYLRMPSAEADNTGCCNDSGTVRGSPEALGHCCAEGANAMNTRLNGRREVMKR
jgi:hypothetical protein